MCQIRNELLYKISFNLSDCLESINKKLLTVHDVFDYCNYLVNQGDHSDNLINLLVVDIKNYTNDFINLLNNICITNNLGGKQFNEKICAIFILQNYYMLNGDFNKKLEFFDSLSDVYNYLFKENNSFMGKFVFWNYSDDDLSNKIKYMLEFLKQFKLEPIYENISIMNFDEYDRLL